MRYIYIYIFLIFAVIILIGLLYFSSRSNQSYNNKELELDKCYPPVTVEFLKKYQGNSKIDELFDIESVVNPLPSINNAICCSLFCKDVNIHNESQQNTPDMSEGGKWYIKYIKPFIENILDRFPETEFYKNGWKMRVYLANDLSEKYLNLFSNYNKFLEIYVMKSSSFGAQPGMLWRFLSYGDESLDMVLSMDIDSPPIDHFYKYVKIFNKYPNHIMFKPDYNCPVVIAEDTDAINKTLILGGQHFVRPKLLGLKNINEIMSSFITYRINAPNPNLYGDHDKENICNKSYGQHIYAWGNHYLMYGFDETFLKHVIFYYIVEKGGMVSLYDKKVLEQYPEEYNYVMKTNPNNIYIDVATI
jgi:hypothetical protein